MHGNKHAQWSPWQTDATMQTNSLLNDFPATRELPQSGTLPLEELKTS